MKTITTKKKIKIKHGGRRPGAGRKFEGDKYRVGLRINVLEIEQVGGEVNARRLLYSLWNEHITSLKKLE